MCPEKAHDNHKYITSNMSVMCPEKVHDIPRYTSSVMSVAAKTHDNPRYNATYVLWKFAQAIVNKTLLLHSSQVSSGECPPTMETKDFFPRPLRLWHYLVETPEHLHEIEKALNVMLILSPGLSCNTQTHLAQLCVHIHKQCLGQMSPYVDVIRSTGALIAIVQRFSGQLWEFLWQNDCFTHTAHTTDLWRVLLVHTKDRECINQLMVELFRRRYKGETMLPEHLKDIALSMGVTISVSPWDSLEDPEDDMNIQLPLGMSLGPTITDQKSQETHSEEFTENTIANPKYDTDVLKSILDCLDAASLVSVLDKACS